LLVIFIVGSLACAGVMDGVAVSDRNAADAAIAQAASLFVIVNNP
jgi:hypothetical protein